MPRDRYVVRRVAGRLVLSGPYDAAKAAEARDALGGGRVVRASSKRSAAIAAGLQRRG